MTIRCYRKTQTNFLAKPICLPSLLNLPVKVSAPLSSCQLLCSPLLPSPIAVTFWPVDIPRDEWNLLNPSHHVQLHLSYHHHSGMSTCLECTQPTFWSQALTSSEPVRESSFPTTSNRQSPRRGHSPHCYHWKPLLWNPWFKPPPHWPHPLSLHLSVESSSLGCLTHTFNSVGLQLRAARSTPTGLNSLITWAGVSRTGLLLPWEVLVLDETVWDSFRALGPRHQPSFLR